MPPRYVKIYLEANGLQECDRDSIMDEYDGKEVANAIHHIYPRGMGGNPGRDVIKNLIALGQTNHALAEAKKIPKEELLEIARIRIEKFERK